LIVMVSQAALDRRASFVLHGVAIGERVSAALMAAHCGSRSADPIPPRRNAKPSASRLIGQADV